MSMSVREFRRGDRDQLTALINRHVSSVLPGVALSTNVVLGQLEREPNEPVIDPWVEQRRCLVAVENEALVGAALLHRFSGDERVSPAYRSAVDIRWLVVEPSAVDAGTRLLHRAVTEARSWDPSHIYADATLPAPGCFGISDTWPHLRSLLVDAGFVGPTRTEEVLAARCDQLIRPTVAGSTVRRRVGPLGVSLDLHVEDTLVGSVEVCGIDPALTRSTAARMWADVGNLWVSRHIASDRLVPALYAAAADWLLLGGITRLIEYHADDVDETRHRDQLDKLGFRVLSVNERGWELPLSSADDGPISTCSGTDPAVYS